VLIEICYFPGFFSNHSLRATCATRLFQAGVDEQLISKHTGHRSVAVRSYKRPSDEQERQLSSILKYGQKRGKIDSSQGPSSTVSVPPSSHGSVASSDQVTPSTHMPAAASVCGHTVPTVPTVPTVTSVAKPDAEVSQTLDNSAKSSAKSGPLTFTFNFHFQ
jgi:hypothetical protein